MAMDSINRKLTNALENRPEPPSYKEMKRKLGLSEGSIEEKEVCAADDDH